MGAIVSSRTDSHTNQITEKTSLPLKVPFHASR